jgi:hypothetical protein
MGKLHWVRVGELHRGRPVVRNQALNNSRLPIRLREGVHQVTKVNRGENAAVVGDQFKRTLILIPPKPIDQIGGLSRAHADFGKEFIPNFTTRPMRALK